MSALVFPKPPQFESNLDELKWLDETRLSLGNNIFQSELPGNNPDISSFEKGIADRLCEKYNLNRDGLYVMGFMNNIILFLIEYQELAEIEEENKYLAPGWSMLGETLDPVDNKWIIKRKEAMCSCQWCETQQEWVYTCDLCKFKFKWEK